MWRLFCFVLWLCLCFLVMLGDQTQGFMKPKQTLYQWS